MSLDSRINPNLWLELIVEKNKGLEARHSGERCFILATGPSIKKQNLLPLKNEKCIAVSNFFVHPDFSIIEPEYYCIAPYHHPLTEEAWQSWMDELAVNVKKSHLFFGINDLKRNMVGERFSGNPVSFIDFSASPQDVIENGLDLSRRTFPVQSVSIMALQIAIFLGFSDIYLLGCDHDWLLHMYESRHFYDENEHAFTKISGENMEWEESDLELECRSYINLWQQYKILRHIALIKEINIFNATEGGMLDVFKLKQLSDVIV